MNRCKLGNRILIARTAKKLTQKQLAQKTKLMQKSISRYERGVSLPSIESLEKPAIVLGQSFSFFLDGDSVTLKL